MDQDLRGFRKNGDFWPVFEGWQLFNLAGKPIMPNGGNRTYYFYSYMIDIFKTQVYTHNFCYMFDAYLVLALMSSLFFLVDCFSWHILRRLPALHISQLASQLFGDASDEESTGSAETDGAEDRQHHN